MGSTNGDTLSRAGQWATSTTVCSGPEWPNGAEVLNVLPAWACALGVGMVGRAGRDPLDPPEEKLTTTQGRERSSCALQKENGKVPLLGTVAVELEVGQEPGGGGREESASLEPLVLRTMAPMEAPMTLKVIDFWNQDISQFETQF